MAEIRFTIAAESDLEAIDNYSLERFGEAIAEVYMHGFDDAFGMLTNHPLSGPTKTELGADIRCLTHRQHRILYRFDGGSVLIIRIIHHAMDSRKALKQ